jgi:hypothetical protein
MLDGVVDPWIRVTDASHRERRFEATAGARGIYEAIVEFRRPGIYTIEAVGFDPRDAHRFVDIGPPVRIPAAARQGTASPDGGLPWAAFAVPPFAILAAFALRRRSGRRD